MNGHKLIHSHSGSRWLVQRHNPFVMPKVSELV
jgi:hypothetical protein